MKARMLTVTIAALSILVGGCVVVPDHPHHVERVRVAPPPPYVEYIGHPPHVGYVWISGYWNWVGVRYVWVPGRWEAPRHGHRWVPHRWERDGDHWRQHGGHWERERHVAPRPEHREPRRSERYDDHRDERERAPAAERNDRWRHDAGPRAEPRDISRMAPNRMEAEREAPRIDQVRPAPERRRPMEAEERGRAREKDDRNERPERRRERSGQDDGR